MSKLNYDYGYRKLLEWSAVDVIELVKKHSETDLMYKINDGYEKRLVRIVKEGKDIVLYNVTEKGYEYHTKLDIFVGENWLEEIRKEDEERKKWDEEYSEEEEARLAGLLEDEEDEIYDYI